MTASPTPFASLRADLVWGFDFEGHDARAVAEAVLDPSHRTGAPPLRWLHLNLANQGSRRWIEAQAAIPEGVRELLLSSDRHQQALIEEGTLACVLHDYEVDFGTDETSRIGPLSIVVGAGFVITARHHPLRSAETIRRRIGSGARPADEAEALDLVVSAVREVAERRALALTAAVHTAEDSLLSNDWEREQQGLTASRREVVQLNRQVSGLRSVLGRLEKDPDLGEMLLAVVEKLSQRAISLQGDVSAVQADLRLLREEIDLEMTRRTNRNLYVLSILSALLLPATLVTGFFGMNTGGMPWNASPHGTLLAGFAALGSAASIYVWLRRRGFLSNR
ncbi:CorA family divalent cation transporter [Aureimonas pseudogalii]|uniref:CorA family divalent cation transporter n=1 Tax=Aureimonas pseudogalii TaxID=1744844 RepID=UPI0035EBF77C